MTAFPSPTPNPSEDRARALLEERKRQVYRQTVIMGERRRALLQEVSAIDEKLDALATKIGVLNEILSEDFPLAQVAKKEPWKTLALPEAADALLAEAGGYLTDSQIRAGLSEHGVNTDSTTEVRKGLENGIDDGAPLMKLNDKLWARRQWEGGGPEAWGRGGPWPIGGIPALVQSPKVCAPRQINKRTGVKHQSREI